MSSNDCLGMIVDFSVASPDRTKIERDADMRISQIEDFNKSEFEKEVSELEKKFNDEINEMNAFYDYNHETIEKEILAEIVGE